MKRKHRKRRDPIKSEKQHSVTAVIIWISSVVFAIVLALIIGNALGKSAEKIPGQSSAPTFSYTYEADAVQPIKAKVFNITNQVNDSIAKLNASAVSLYLRKGSGAPAYKSNVANAILGVTGAFDLVEYVSAFHKKDIYVSACFDCYSFSIKSSSAREAAIAFEAAMIAEIADAGVDDIVLLGLPVTDEGIAYASELFKKVREINANAILGAAIDYTNIISPNGAAALEDYSKFADFCAIDASNAQSNGASAASIANSLIYAFEVYPLRLLISISGDADFDAQTKSINDLGITNIQAYKYLTVSAG